MLTLFSLSLVGVVTTSLENADILATFTEPGLAIVVRYTQLLLWEWGVMGDAKETILVGEGLWGRAKLGVLGGLMDSFLVRSLMRIRCLRSCIW